MRSFIRYTTYLILLTALREIQSGAPQGYVINMASGHGYKIMYRAQPWTQARDICAQNGAKLAVPKSVEEFKFIQKVVRGMHYPSIIGSDFKLLVWLGISNLEDYGKWKNIDGENIEGTEFHVWADRYDTYQSTNPSEPHCAGMDAANFGLRSYWCHRKQPYICEIITNA